MRSSILWKWKYKIFRVNDDCSCNSSFPMLPMPSVTVCFAAEPVIYFQVDSTQYPTRSRVFRGFLDAYPERQSSVDLPQAGLPFCKTPVQVCPFCKRGDCFHPFSMGGAGTNDYFPSSANTSISMVKHLLPILIQTMV